MSKSTDKRNSQSLRRYIMKDLVFCGVIIVLIILETSGLSILYATNNQKYIKFLYLMIALTIVLISLLFVGGVILSKKLYNVLYKDLYKNTKSNLDSLRYNKKEFTSYEEQGITEFNELNNIISETQAYYNTSFVSNIITDYSDIPFMFVDERKTVATYKSFVKYINELVSCASSFRNAFISLTYDIGEYALTNREKLNLFDQIKKVLSYEGIFIADNSDDNEYIIYVPNFDSISKLNEDVETLLKNTSVILNKVEGKGIAMCKASVVVYPYSAPEDIIADLRYANRQEKIINFYLPTRNIFKTNSCRSNNMNINAISKYIERLSTLQTSVKDPYKLKNDIRKILLSICQFLDIDSAGVVLYNPIDNNYKALISSSLSSPIKEDSIIDPDFVNLVDIVKDRDLSYYFSSRKHANGTIGRFLDKYGVNAGHLFAIKNDDENLGFVYFFKNDDLHFDSYLRESLNVFSYYIASLLKETKDKIDVINSEKRLNDVLKISNLKLYTVDRDTYKLNFVSESLKDFVGSAKEGATCYKCLYNKQKPCENCPLLSGNKKNDLLNNVSYETSMAMNNSKKEHFVTMLLSMTDDNRIPRDRFDRDLMTNSYYSLLENIQNAFIAKQKGYVLLLSIDNMNQLLEKYSNEDVNYLLRQFVNKTNELLDRTCKIFTYRNDTLAIMLPEKGRTDVIDLVQKIYEASKIDYMQDNKKIKLSISYIAENYPLDFFTNTDYVRHLDSVLSEISREGNDMMYFPAIKYSRPASRKEFIVSVIDNAFENKLFEIKIQPFVDKQNKVIEAGELLLRLSDNFSETEINTKELIDVAAETGKITLITSALVQRIGEMNRDYGNKWFKRFGLNKLTMNTDFSYFQDSKFIDKLTQAQKEFALPKGFLNFEIDETELEKHFDYFKSISNKIIKNDICLICDNYTGEHLRIEKLKDLGISMVKISRAITLTINSDATKLSKIKQLMKLISDNGMTTTIVGVENREQYALLKSEVSEFSLQGYFFYKPLSTEDFLRVLQKNK